MLGAGLIAVLVTLPILTIVLLSFASSENIWPHLLGTVLPGYVWRTLGLMVGVGFLTFIIGTATAWLVSLHDFPLRRILQWACLMPLAMPTYIVSYTYVDFLNYAGAAANLAARRHGVEPSRRLYVSGNPFASRRGHCAGAGALPLCLHDGAGELPAPAHEPA